jgi:O-antigen/teichoic acid export membrane protein
MVSISAAVFPGCVCAVAVPGLLLDLWLGHDFSQHAAPILRILGIGAFFDCLVFVPLGLMEGIGRFDVNAKFVAAETAIFVPVLFLFVSQLGVQGAVFAWLGRVSLACLAALLVARRLYPPAGQEIWRFLPTMAGAFPLMIVPAMVPSLGARAVMMGVVVLLYLTLIWLSSLTVDERSLIRVKISKAACVGALIRKPGSLR